MVNFFISYSVDGYPDHLQKAVVGLISRITCGSLLGTESITDNMICAGYERGDIDTCDVSFPSSTFDSSINSSFR